MCIDLHITCNIYTFVKKHLENVFKTMIHASIGFWCTRLIALFSEKFTQLAKFLHDRRSQRSRQISTLSLSEVDTGLGVFPVRKWTTVHSAMCRAFCSSFCALHVSSLHLLCIASLFVESLLLCASFTYIFCSLHLSLLYPLRVALGPTFWKNSRIIPYFFLEDIPNGSFHTIFQCWRQLWSFSCDEGNPLPHWSCWGENMHWRSHSKKTALSLETFYPHGNHCGPCTDTVTLHRNHGNFPSSVETHLETILVLLSWGYPLIHHLQLPLQGITTKGSRRLKTSSQAPSYARRLQTETMTHWLNRWQELSVELLA